MKHHSFTVSWGTGTGYLELLYAVAFWLARRALQLFKGTVVQLVAFLLLLTHLLLVLQDLLGCELEDVGLWQSILADGTQEVLICIEDPRLLQDTNYIRKHLLLFCA
jgi:hypothetical protein